ncbi:CvfD/Ygs/GSP13 family RNA-binding post-transcriptional regulator [Secundilactobacillus folii]|uniref:S1 RNA-binding domain-containing protein n=1 Tax=Secundilactobacillus folii TaxID=2678357 RepID=A0A7X2XY48_9LACO|nr:CvfD/Ygs/GSP13 family RNA-binding post-transcriptional regulator [Secundilactobacillus folii]MTV83215.1 S1 RNA-binding domain-containing protein [Secundilactobacillus folii]
MRIGDHVHGTVTGIQPYGAFVDLGSGRQGLIHISECHYGYVKDIHDYLQVGDEIDVIVLDIDEFTGKISLSLRCLAEKQVPLQPVVSQQENFHKHYWTNRNVHEGFKPIQKRRHSWEQEAMSEFVKK